MLTSLRTPAILIILLALTPSSANATTNEEDAALHIWWGVKLTTVGTSRGYGIGNILITSEGHIASIPNKEKFEYPCRARLRGDSFTAVQRGVEKLFEIYKPGSHDIGTPTVSKKFGSDGLHVQISIKLGPPIPKFSEFTRTIRTLYLPSIQQVAEKNDEHVDYPAIYHFQSLILTLKHEYLPTCITTLRMRTPIPMQDSVF